MIKDEWRITSHAIELEMERIAGLLQKSARFQSRGERTAARQDAAASHSDSESPELAPLTRT